MALARWQLAARGALTVKHIWFQLVSMPDVY
eukprot:COSAG04_NODE_23285_length_341_cov_0.590909_1_plen_30_part_01